MYTRVFSSPISLIAGHNIIILVHGIVQVADEGSFVVK